MTPPLQPLTEQQRRGRTFLLCALALLSFMYLKESLAGLLTSSKHLTGSLTNLTLCFLVIRQAYLGGKTSSFIIRILTALLAVVSLGGLTFIFVGMMQGHTLPERMSLETSVTTYGNIFGVSFSLWALFLSPEVKSFLAYQRARVLARGMEKIHQETEASKRRHALS